VFLPIPADAEVGVRLEMVADAAGKEQFLLVCRGYLKKEYPEAEKDFTGWYEANIKVWPAEIRAAFLAELSESVENTPVGKERTAVGTENSDKAKLQVFLESLAHKHRPR
jgi:hypothetical protein